MRRYRRARRMNPQLRWKPIFVLALLLVLLFSLNRQLRPVINTYATNEARIISVTAINQAVTDALAGEGIAYADFAVVSRGGDGAVQSITTDMARMNLFKEAVLKKVQHSLADYGHKNIGVPLGTLLGSDIMHGWGPNVPFRLTLSGNVTADFKSLFESAGINQTKHQIYLNVHAKVYSFLPGFEAAIEVETNVPVAETIIVGQVPKVVADFK